MIPISMFPHFLSPMVWMSVTHSSINPMLYHLMNGYCANHATAACAEVSRHVRSPVKMAIVVAEIVIDGYRRRLIPPVSH